MSLPNPHEIRKSLDASNGAAAEPAAPPVPIIVQMSTVQSEPVRWLVPGWLPQGALTILDGDPGLGKSTLTLDLAARLTTSRSVWFGDQIDLRGPASVLLLGAEDSLRHTVRPRLDAAEADCKRVFCLEGFRAADGHERPPMLPFDVERVEDMIKENGILLVVVDPFMAFLGGEYDAHKDQDIRRCLRPLAAFAERMEITVLLLRHLNKLAGGPALYRGGSSIGIAGASRAALIVGRDPDADRHVLAMNKINVGPRPTSLAYRIESVETTCRIVWEGETDLHADQILGHGGPTRMPGRPDVALQEAQSFLAILLANGPVPSTDAEAAAEKAGIKPRTLGRAKTAMKVRSRKVGKVWQWELPEGSQPNPVCEEDVAEMDEDEQEDLFPT